MDKNKLIEEITAVIMERLANEGQPPKVVVFGDVPAGVVGGGCEIRKGNSPADVQDAEYIVLSAGAFRAFHHIPEPTKQPEEQPSEAAAEHAPQGAVIDLTGNRLVHEMDLRQHNLRQGDMVLVDKNAIITALAYDYVNTMKAEICSR